MNLIIVEINFDDTYFQLVYAQNVGNVNAFSKCCKKIVYIQKEWIFFYKSHGRGCCCY